MKYIITYGVWAFTSNIHKGNRRNRRVSYNDAQRTVLRLGIYCRTVSIAYTVSISII